MPVVKIELAQGRELSQLIMLKTLVADVLVEVLQLPPDDRNVRIAEYPPALFCMKEPYRILIEITMFSGRSASVRKCLFRTLADTLEANAICRVDEVFIVLQEQSPENWGIRGGIPASELTLNFKVDI